MKLIFYRTRSEGAEPVENLLNLFCVFFLKRRESYFDRPDGSHGDVCFFTNSPRQRDINIAFSVFIQASIISIIRIRSVSLKRLTNTMRAQFFGRCIGLADLSKLLVFCLL